MLNHSAVPAQRWAAPDDVPAGEAFASEVDDLIDRLKTLPDFINEAAYGGNLRNAKVRDELQAQWRIAKANFDAQLLFDTECDMHDAYANELIFSMVERDRESESLVDVEEARRILDLYRGVKA